MSSQHSVILPGATLGVLGSGQLGRMFAIAARRLGYRVHVYSPDTDTPAGQVGDFEFTAPYEDLEQVRRFARGVDVVTFEFENVPSTTSQTCAEIVPVRPDGNVLHVTQQRLREKTFLQSNGFPVTPFRRIQTLADLEEAVRNLGLPAVLKTASFGYDGKGQRKIREISEVPSAFAGLAGAEGIYEAFVDFEKEVSVVAARSADGAFDAFPVFENSHSNHILDITFAAGARDPRSAAGGRPADGRTVRDPGWTPSGQRTGPADPQLGSPHPRRLHHLPVRAAGPGGVRSAAGFHRHDPAGGDGQPAGRRVDPGHPRLVLSLVRSFGQIAPLRQGRGPARTEDGASQRHGGDFRRGGPPGPRRKRSLGFTGPWNGPIGLLNRPPARGIGPVLVQIRSVAGATAAPWFSEPESLSSDRSPSEVRPPLASQKADRFRAPPKSESATPGPGP